MDFDRIKISELVPTEIASALDELVINDVNDRETNTLRIQFRHLIENIGRLGIVFTGDVIFDGNVGGNHPCFDITVEDIIKWDSNTAHDGKIFIEGGPGIITTGDVASANQKVDTTKTIALDEEWLKQNIVSLGIINDNKIGLIPYSAGRNPSIIIDHLTGTEPTTNQATDSVTTFAVSEPWLQSFINDNSPPPNDGKITIEGNASIVVSGDVSHSANQADDKTTNLEVNEEWLRDWLVVSNNLEPPGDGKIEFESGPDSGIDIYVKRTIDKKDTTVTANQKEDTTTYIRIDKQWLGVQIEDNCERDRPNDGIHFISGGPGVFVSDGGFSANTKDNHETKIELDEDWIKSVACNVADRFQDVDFTDLPQLP